MSSTLRIAILVGSTRTGRNGEGVARWVLDRASRRTDATFELVDLADHPLPHLDEALPPRMQQYENPLVWEWSRVIDGYDGYVVVTPEYNHAPPAVLKNAMDWLYHEWTDKAVGFVGYGAQGGARAVEQLRLVAGELRLADVRTAVGLSLYDDFEEFRTLAPRERHARDLDATLDEVVAWSGALATVRAARAVSAA
ncbi:NADPH-dependent FMN reductase [Cellulosimicrobium composti]|uniref:NAD(P)H-dependent oxidoreductase n=1 Tax=Cellulosimicrobium composti TaxID=2672572 RepID=A0ABX0BBJ0_9MICO|nr:NAD(P)H-dependent oxidoreductase [Cellulosimicrobium composti]NDO88720.1 NAD(P)H-dependent oxidoreductase [Cellulosimicrobium composti]TWG85876.1 NAD(P)H-dependent FMN reductase [Cellulosimicrobium cellulans J34]SMF04493.1 NAD(P)H-dependent FMN reductase [Cellulosimicrobium cellulans J1]